MTAVFIRALLLCGALALAGCDQAVRLGLAPNVYSNIDFYPEAAVPVHQRTAAPDLFFVTDRNPQPEGAPLPFGHDRSDAMAFGTAQVRFGNGMDWEDLVFASVRNTGRGPRIPITLAGTETLVRFPATPLPFEEGGGGAPRILPEAQARQDAARRAVQGALAEELRRANRAEVVLFVHGFRNDFADGHATLANIWHFSGRIGVPVLYSWPANNPGIFGYFKDRESGEFTIFHLKQFLTLLAGIPELEKIHIVAHSRGADVTTSALRELVIAERAAGRRPERTLKVENLVLAAPDLDFGVVRQRLIAERFGTAFGQISVYLNQKDTALRLAQTLMSGVRMGRLQIDDLRPDVRATLRRIGNVHFIDVEQPGSALSHSYFRDNPAVVSDIILTIRTGAGPGGAERPLAALGDTFWSLPANYPDPDRVAALWEPRLGDEDR